MSETLTVRQIRSSVLLAFSGLLIGMLRSATLDNRTDFISVWPSGFAPQQCARIGYGS